MTLYVVSLRQRNKMLWITTYLVLTLVMYFNRRIKLSVNELIEDAMRYALTSLDNKPSIALGRETTKP
jgi:hypothetical protein